MNRPRDRWVANRNTIGLTAVLGAALAVSASTVAGAATDTTATSPIVVPLQSSTTTPTTAWAVVEMGTSQGSYNHFWELFDYHVGTRRWLLETPPGIADNGGLIIATSGPYSGLVGFGANQLLAFSPLASTSDAGSNWSPGGLSQALVPVPDALAAGADNSGAALVRANGSDQVLRRTGSLTSWSSIATTRDVAKSAPSCRIDALTALDIPAPSTILLGASCSSVGSVPLLRYSGGSWSLVKVTTPATWIHNTTQVLRLANGQGASGIVPEGLLAGEGGSTTVIAAVFNARPGSAWSVSQSLHLARGAVVVASGSGPATTQFVVVRQGGTLVADVITGPDAKWQTSGELPKGTATIAIEPDGSLDAMSVKVSTLSIWHAARVDAPFSKSQTIDVPIQYGSSG